MAAATSQPRPANIPGQQRNEGQRLHLIPRLEWIAERLENAVGAGPEVRPAPVLGEDHRLPGKAGKVDSLVGGERRLDQFGGRHFAVVGGIGEHDAGGVEGLDRAQLGSDRAAGCVHLGDGERPPSAAHLLPDRSFRVVHPLSKSDGDGRRWSVVRSRDQSTLHGKQSAQTSESF